MTIRDTTSGDEYETYRWLTETQGCCFCGHQDTPDTTCIAVFHNGQMVPKPWLLSWDALMFNSVFVCLSPDCRSSELTGPEMYDAAFNSPPDVDVNRN